MPSFKDCIRAELGKSKLSKAKVEKILEDFDKLEKNYRTKGASPERAAKIAESIFRKQQADSTRAKLLAERALLDQEEMLETIRNTPGGLSEGNIETMYQHAAWRGDQLEETMHSLMDESLKDLKMDVLGRRDTDNFTKAVRIVEGDKSIKDPRALKLAEGINAVHKYAHSEAVKVHAKIGKKENYFPRSLRSAAILKAGGGDMKKAREVFKAHFKQDTILDLTKMIDDETGLPFRTFDELDPVLDSIFDKKFGLKKNSATGFGSDIDARHARSRFFEYKSPEAALETNRKFGVGDEGLPKLFLDNIQQMSRDIGLMQYMGVKPNAMKNRVLTEFGNELRAKGGKAVNTRLGQLEGQYNVLTSQFDRGDVDHIVYRALMGSLNLMRGTVMGSASISALTDSVFGIAASRGNGIPAIKNLKFTLDAMTPGTNLTKKIAAESGLVGKMVQVNAAHDTRFANSPRTQGWTAKFAEWTNKWSGLDFMTKRKKVAMVASGTVRLGDFVDRKISWDAMGKEGLTGEGRRLREALENFGVTKDDWNFVLKNSPVLQQIDGVPVFIPNRFRFQNFADTATAFRAAEVSNKIGDWFQMLQQSATNEALVKTRLYSSGAFISPRAGGAGTISKAMASALLMFKTFPISVMFTHTGPAIRKTFGRNRTMTQRAEGAEQLMWSVVFAGILGVGVRQLKNLKDGKELEEWDSPGLWTAGLFQGGGLGLWGDFAYGGGSNRFQRKLGEEAAGPFVAMLSDLASTGMQVPNVLFGDDLKKQKAANKIRRGLWRTLRRTAFPQFGTLWYTRLPAERMLLDHFERWIDDEYDQRQRKYRLKMQRDKSQDFYWAPGDFTP